MNRPVTPQRLLIGLCVLLVACQSTPEPPPLEVTLLHINDHHSHLEGHSLRYPTTGLSLTARTQNGFAPEHVRLHYGGFPRLSSLFTQQRSKHTHVLSLHAGDAITGTPYFNLFEGEADAALMNHICFEAFELGNHEFDKGDKGLAHFLSALTNDDCGTDILGANVVPGPESPLQNLPLKPYALYEFDGQTIAVIGLDIAQKTRQSSSPDPGTQFLYETETAQRYIDELTARGIERIILLTHYQYENDQTLARNLTDVDVIVGGDSHTLLASDDIGQLGLTPEGPYPTRTLNRDGDPVCIVQAWEHARAMGQLTVRFDAAGKVAQCDGEILLPMDPAITFEYATDDWRPLPDTDRQNVRATLNGLSALHWVSPDPSMQRVLEPYREPVVQLRERSIGQLQQTLCHARLPGDADCRGLGHLPRGSEIATIVVHSFLRAVPDADIALQNAGGVRTHLEAGTVTQAEMQRLLPFGNTLVRTTLTGKELHQVLEQGVAYALSPDGSDGGYPYAAGVRFNVDPSAPDGHRLTDIAVNPQLSGDWRPLDPERHYQVVMNSYLASGGDGYDLLEDKTVEATPIVYAQPLADWLRSLQAEGRALSPPENDTFSTQRFR